MGGKKRTADSFVASEESCQLIKFTNYINRFTNRVSCITRKDSPFRSHSYFCSRLWIQHSTDLKRKGGLQAVYGGKERDCRFFWGVDKTWAMAHGLAHGLPYGLPIFLIGK